MPTYLEPALIDSRIIRPAFAHGFVFSCASTRAVVETSPEHTRHRKLNLSALLQISFPPPLTVKRSLEKLAQPVWPGLPISMSVQPAGITPTVTRVALFAELSAARMVSG